MFDNLTSKLQSAYKSITGKSSLTEENIAEALSEVRRSLLEADVALPVVRSFIDSVKSEALGQKVSNELTPYQAFMEILYNNLVKLMGEKNEKLNLLTQPPAVILMAGLQGAGKTTHVAKLAKLLKSQKKKVLVVSADVYRPAAIEQLRTLALQVDVDFYPSSVDQNPVDIVKAAKEAAKKSFYDVLIVDTAGRLHVDEDMMNEIKAIHQALNPIETLFTVDAMTGQDAANTAKAFNDSLPLTGVILTKLDGDARGGAALSIRYITGKPIKFIGVGEKIDDLEAFYPDRIASRILDMGDLLTLIEKIKSNVSEKQVKKITKAKDLTLDDFLDQLETINKLGSTESLIGMLPGMGQHKDKIDFDKVDRELNISKSIIRSMTKKERQDPSIIKHSRKQRISRGCGQPVQKINQLLTQYEQMKQVMKMMKGGSLTSLLSKLGGAGLSGMANMANMFGRNGKR